MLLQLRECKISFFLWKILRPYDFGTKRRRGHSEGVQVVQPSDHSVDGPSRKEHKLVLYRHSVQITKGCWALNTNNPPNVTQTLLDTSDYTTVVLPKSDTRVLEDNKVSGTDRPESYRVSSANGSRGFRSIMNGTCIPRAPPSGYQEHVTMND